MAITNYSSDPLVISRLQKRLMRCVCKVGLLAILHFLIGCTTESNRLSYALELAGHNKLELENFIEQYQSRDSDSLKLKAARFLISNMPGHFHYDYKSLYKSAIDTFSYHQEVLGMSNSSSVRAFNKVITEKKTVLNKTRANLKSDLESLSSKFLTENLELAFEAWLNTPEKIRPSFEIFKEYVLPYRVHNEFPETGLRRSLMQKFFWVHREINEGKDLVEVCNRIIDSLNLNPRYPQADSFEGALPASLLLKLRRAKCDDEVVLASLAFRAVGIPTSFDFTPHWGDHWGNGHSWLTIHLPNGVLVKDPLSNSTLNTVYQFASFSKVFRRTYSLGNKNADFFGHHTKEIEDFYLPTHDVSIELNSSFSNKKLISLKVFNSKRSWVTVDVIEADWLSFFNKVVKLKNLHRRCVYVLFQELNGIEEAVSDAFTINEHGEVHYYRTKGLLKKIVRVDEKYPIRIVDHHFIRLIEDLNGCTLWGANEAGFQHAQLLHEVSNLRSATCQLIRVEDNFHPFKYYKFKAPKPEMKRVPFLSELVFFDSLNQPLEAANINVMSSAAGRYKISEKLLDNDPFSFVGGPNLEIDVSFDSEVKIASMQFRSRNRDNGIRIGDEYELFYWSGEGWTSIHKQVASTKFLTFSNLPKAALFWLKNHSRGNMEQLFTITENGEQTWPCQEGVDVFETIKLIPEGELSYLKYRW